MYWWGLFFEKDREIGHYLPMAQKQSVGIIGVGFVGGAVKFWFSADGQNWQEVPTGKNIDFSAPLLKNFFLKVTFSTSAAKFYSPFLSAVLFDYYFKSHR